MSKPANNPCAMKPIPEMTYTPVGMPLMVDAWIGLLYYAASNAEAIAQFKADTGHDLLSALNARGINAMIDKATGHEKTVIVAFADWMTREIWGDESNPEAAL